MVFFLMSQLPDTDADFDDPDDQPITINPKVCPDWPALR